MAHITFSQFQQIPHFFENKCSGCYGFMRTEDQDVFLSTDCDHFYHQRCYYSLFPEAELSEKRLLCFDCLSQKNRRLSSLRVVSGSLIDALKMRCAGMSVAPSYSLDEIFQEKAFKKKDRSALSWMKEFFANRFVHTPSDLKNEDRQIKGVFSHFLRNEFVERCVRFLREAVNDLQELYQRND